MKTNKQKSATGNTTGPNADLTPLAIDSPLTAAVKNYALAHLNADLTGIAGIERFAHAPPQMSPQGLMPSAQSVIVMANHHLDATIEIGGMEHPQKMGPYRLQKPMNNRNDELSYRMALFLEDKGYRAVPITSSNIWRYNGYKDLKEHFAPDVSHMHCAVAAGLADFGYNGLALTPEYGARQRFVTVVTDAVLTPTPLLEPGSICDDCMLCRKHCLSDALSKEIDGWNIVKIEDKEYRYAKKNLWRCAWGEHFGLDLDAEKPEKVTEEYILDFMDKHGRRGGEMGSCLRYCVPKHLRYFDKNYTNAPRRKRQTLPNNDFGLDRGLWEKVRSLADKYRADGVISQNLEQMKKAGFDADKILPDAQTGIIVVSFRNKKHADTGAWAETYAVSEIAYDMCRELQRNGFSALTSLLDEESVAYVNKLIPETPDSELTYYLILTSAVLPSTSLDPRAAQTQLAPKPLKTMPPEVLKNHVTTLLRGYGMDISGVSTAERLDAVIGQVEKHYNGETILYARDKNSRCAPYEPEIVSETLTLKYPRDYVANAKSVIVIGLRLPEASLDCTARYDNEAVGPYAFALYESARLISTACRILVRELEQNGYEAEMTLDLAGTASFSNNPRELTQDIFGNRLAAVAAGLGRLTKSGFVMNTGYGARMRYAAVITDAVMAADPVCTEPVSRMCESCSRCLDACLTGAFQQEISFDLEGIRESFYRIDHNRCNWAKRYSLVSLEGTRYSGWDLDVAAPETITEDNLAAALKQTPPIKKHHPCNFERCLLACPAVREQD